jgi:hypothetical protein
MKYFLTLALLSLIFFKANSQSDRVITGTKITKQQTPDEVIKALEANSPMQNQLNITKYRRILRKMDGQ